MDASPIQQWHMLDYVIVRQRDHKDVHITRCMRGAECWSDHRLIRSKMNLQLADKKQPARVKPPRKLNISLLPAASVIFQQKLTEALGEDSATANTNAEEEWCTFENSIYTVAADTLGFVKRSRRDWFDPDISKLLDMLPKKHHEHLADKTCQKKERSLPAGKTVCSLNKLNNVQSRLRQMKNA